MIRTGYPIIFLEGENMNVKIEVMPEVITVRLNGDIDHHTAAPIREKVDSEIMKNQPSLLVLDFGGVDFMDSSGIGFVMGRYRLLKNRDARIDIVGAAPHIEKVLRLAGLEKLANIETAERRK